MTASILSVPLRFPCHEAVAAALEYYMAEILSSEMRRRDRTDFSVVENSSAMSAQLPVMGVIVTVRLRPNRSTVNFFTNAGRCSLRDYCLLVVNN